MKPLVTGAVSFVVGAAASAGVLASSNVTPGNLDKAAVESIVHDYIIANPDVIVESVQKWQQGNSNKQSEAAKEAVKKEQKALLNDSKDGAHGPKNADVTVVEFFDYNCPACHMMFKGIDELAHKDKKVRIVFKELPIFGQQSEENSRVGLAVVGLAPEKYFEFHEKMMGGEGRKTPEQAIKYAVELGLKEEDVKNEMQKEYINAKINANHELAEKLGVSGTPALVVGEQLVPSAVDYPSLKSMVENERKGK